MNNILRKDKRMPVAVAMATLMAASTAFAHDDGHLPRLVMADRDHVRIVRRPIATEVGARAVVVDGLEFGLRRVLPAGLRDRELRRRHPTVAEEAPAHRVAVDGFWIDRSPVTNEQWSSFVEATGHVTFAETTPAADDYPGARPDLLVPASMVFTPPGRPVSLDDHYQWWSYVPGADWRHPPPRNTVATAATSRASPGARSPC